MDPVRLSPVFAVLPILPVLPSIAAIAVALGFSVLLSLSVLLRPRFWRQLLILLWRQKLGILALTIIVAVPAMLLVRWGIHDNSGTFFGRGSLQDPGTSVSAHSARRFTPASRRDQRERGPNRGGLNWGAASGFRFFASPAVSAGRVYCVGSDGDRGRFFCWDQYTGELLWTSAPKDYRATYSSPVIVGNYLLCGEGLHHCRDARIVCLDLSPGHEGELLWEWRTSSHVECTPVVADGRVYVNAGDDGIYCLEIDPDLEPSQRLVWHLPGDQYPDAETALTVHQDRLYVGLGMGGKALCVLDRETGRELTRIEQPHAVYARPAVAGKRLFVGCGGGNLLTSDEQSAGQVCCIDLETMKPIWAMKTPDAVMGAVIVDHDDLYFGSADGTLFHLSLEGDLVSKWTAHSRLVISPAVTRDMVYVATADGALTGLTRGDLEPIWHVRLGAPGAYVSSPRVSGGRLFVGTPDHGFQCLGERSTPNTLNWAGAGGGPGCNCGCNGGLLPSTGKPLWSFTLSKMPAGDQVVAPLAVTDRELAAQVFGADWNGIVCLDNRGALPPDLRWKVSTGATSRLAVAIAGSTVLVQEAPPTGGAVLRALNRKTGSETWKRKLRTASRFVVDENSIFLSSSSSGQLMQLTFHNEIVWSVDIGRLDHAVHFTPALVVAATSNPPAVRALDRSTGRTLWQSPLQSLPVGSPVIVETRVVVPSESGVEVRSLVNGEPAVVVDEQAVPQRSPGSSAAIDKVAVFFDRTGRLVELDTHDGSVARRKVEGASRFGPMVGWNRILYVAGNRMLSVSRRGHDADEGVWSELNLDGMATPPLVHMGRVYVGVPGEGLICLGRAGEQ